MKKDTRICKNPDCKKEHDGNQVKRSLGKESSIYLLGYCSAKCFTKIVTSPVTTLKLLEKIKIWPNRDGYKVERLNKHDMGSHEAQMLKAEAELWLFMTTTIKSEVGDWKFKKLEKLIEDYADEKYETANLECAEDAAGADL